MKRIKPAKRRDRKTGLSPYARHNKWPYEYSAAYKAWRAQFKRRDKKQQKTEE